MTGSPEAEFDLVRIDAASYRRTPWKNGGGVTIDIADAYRPGAQPGGWAGMIWRFGRTRIELPAPFSDLTGNDRVLAVVGGRGLVLRVADGRALDVREPFRPVHFPGEWDIRSELDEGPVDVLNLIGDRRALELDLRFAARAESLAIRPGETVVYAPLDDVVVRIDGERLAIRSGDAVRLRTGRATGLEAENGLVAVAQITHTIPIAASGNGMANDPP